MKKPILTYCLIAYAVSWAIAFGIYALFRNGQLTADQLNLYHSFAAIGPTIGALISARLYYGRNGIIRLLGKLKYQPVDKKVIWLLISPFLFFLIGLLVFGIVKMEWYSFDSFREANLVSFRTFFAWILPLITYSVFEEIGWRGFLLPHLQEQYKAWTATIYLTVIWAFWHFPFFFYRFDFSLFISVGFFFGIFVGAIILTSIYNSSKGFLWGVILFHFLNNFFSMFDKEIIVSVLSVGFVFLAVYIYKKYGRVNLSEGEKIKNYFIRDGV